MKKKTESLKPIPLFKSEAAEKKFWETHDSAKYIDWKNAKNAVFPELKPSKKSHFRTPQ